MLNQAAVEALYSATYVENYLDCVENLPDDLQRHLSRMRELDVSYQAFLKELEAGQQALLGILGGSGGTSGANQRKRALLRKVQTMLIAAQEVGDEKLQVVQAVLDLIENKSRQLDLDFRNLDFGKDQENTEPNRDSMPHNIGGGTGSGQGGGGGSTPSASGGTVAERSSERHSKRARRTRTESTSENGVVSGAFGGAGTGAIGFSAETGRTTNVSASAALSGGGGGGGGGSGGNTGSQRRNASTGGKKKKRKSKQERDRERGGGERGSGVGVSGGSANASGTVAGSGESPPQDIPVDPDEPTYCLCDQISFGEMILCDNDLCPIEWFHFGCVSLVSKPKGRWFCPRCRGERASVMKPKALFLRELERYNREKEEKA
ncbi:inhibitor of growth protein 1 [Hetaerina americana]|uniref:inhibitor of growth protein 1 n=1 Tax=Hetaerina americana TaxID=62018 RepID=UPI003A7F4D07